MSDETEETRTIDSFDKAALVEALQIYGVSIWALIGIEDRQRKQAAAAGVRCTKCSFGMLKTPGQSAFCDCPLGRDLQRDAERKERAKRRSEIQDVKHVEDTLRGLL